jgi:hypothetical protein
MALDSSGPTGLSTYALVIGAVLLSCTWPFLLFGLLPKVTGPALRWAGRVAKRLGLLLRSLVYWAVVIVPVEP